MLIVYRKQDRLIASNSGTNSARPRGARFAIEVQNAVNRHGGEPADYAGFRLHDVEDADTVQAILGAGSYELVFDDDGTPVDVTIYPRLTLSVSPDAPAVDQNVTVTASVEGDDVTFRVIGVDGSQETVASSNGEASVVYAFSEPGSYTIAAESSTKYGRASIGIEVE